LGQGNVKDTQIVHFTPSSQLQQGDQNRQLMIEMVDLHCITDLVDSGILIMVRKTQKPARAEGTAPDPLIPGEFLMAAEPIQANVGRQTVTVQVTNTGDRPIQVGSHFHFFEVNRALQFERGAGFGMRLNIPSGNAVRFEPGQTHTVTLVALGGKGVVYGFNGLTEGSVRTSIQKQQALKSLADWMN
jgi:urease beta subunit